MSPCRTMTLLGLGADPSWWGGLSISLLFGSQVFRCCWQSASHPNAMICALQLVLTALLLGGLALLIVWPAWTCLLLAAFGSQPVPPSNFVNARIVRPARQGSPPSWPGLFSCACRPSAPCEYISTARTIPQDRTRMAQSGRLGPLIHSTVESFLLRAFFAQLALSRAKYP